MWFIRHDWDDKKKMADCLANLPVDKHQPSSSEVQIMNSLFQPRNIPLIKAVGGEFKEAALGGLIFFILSLPIVDGMICKFITAASSPYILLGIKSLLFIFIYWIINHFYLAKKKQ